MSIKLQLIKSLSRTNGKMKNLKGKLKNYQVIKNIYYLYSSENKEAIILSSEDKNTYMRSKSHFKTVQLRSSKSILIEKEKSST